LTIESPITKKDMWFTGEDQNLEWDIRDDGGQQVDITLWTMEFRFAGAQGDAAIIIKPAIQVLPARARVTILDTDTGSLQATKYFYTLSRTDPGFNQVLAYGDAMLQGRVL
jgi:hypothetical protein